MKIKNIIGFILLPAFLLSCAVNTEISEETKNKVLIKDNVPRPVMVRGNTYAREIIGREGEMLEVPSVNGRNLRLSEILSDAFPGYRVIPANVDVDLYQEISIRNPSMPANEMLSYLGAITDYDFKITGRKITVSSFITKEWNMGVYSENRTITNRSVTAQITTTDGSDSNSQNLSSIESLEESGSDRMGDLVASARSIMGVQEEDGASVGGSQDSTSLAPPVNVDYVTLDSEVGGGKTGSEITDGSPSELEYGEIERLEPFVIADSLSGIITAGGSPSKISRLDNFLRSRQDINEATINVKITAYDVTLNENQEKGIDWNKLIEGSINGNDFNITSTFQRDPSLTSPLFQVGGTYTGGRGALSGTLSLLRQFGEVEIIDQPNITTLHGVAAKIHSPNRIPIVVGYETATDDAGSTISNPTIEFLSVGVSFSVTPRILRDGKILLDVWPVISSENGSRNFTFNGESVAIPVVSQKDLATKVIARSGESIYLGGLIQRQIAENLSGLPIKSKNGAVKGFFKSLFDQEANSAERRELVIVITPTILDDPSS